MTLTARFTGILRLCAAAIAVAAGLSSLPAQGESAAPAAAAPGYDRLLPLEGGSNFRDLGGYFTADGRQVRRGLLFRSGVMTSLTAADQAYLAAFDFQGVVDLRSSEERALYPNRWVAAQEIELLTHDYSMREIVARMMGDDGQPLGMGELYRGFPQLLEPQLRLFFEALLAGQVPLVVNCSAGQDRTGFASALLLSALGVPRDVILQDYLVSTRYRRPEVERGDVDLAAAARDNFFAQLMLRYSEGEEAKAAQPLLTEEGVPFLRYALDQVEQDFGSIERYLEERLGVDKRDREELRRRFLVATYAAS
ncbi:tyrosine-protein phosphatase [Pseudohaliea rubra]|uniref:Protein tyrosine phosphatase n=1 Tax=Pseudohaliea rubra DSM 19751 TaxID=1265313 RepID=A0A095VTB0_9GAMM|nr:tyrosine-protein phosphatase [Pseudohaliea rubra]KGE04687.1 Protein tyrosine phosphatase [Pseudohaliea rubra DSM 19751]